MTNAKPATDEATRTALADALAKATPLGNGRWELCWDANEPHGFDGIIFRPESGDASAPIFSDGDGVASPNTWPAREQDRRDFDLLVQLRNAAEGLLADANALDAERARVKELEDACRSVRDTFARDIAQGFRSRSRVFAIQVLGAALKEPANG